jgi:hypothetical protein
MIINADFCGMNALIDKADLLSLQIFSDRRTALAQPREAC